MKLYLFMYILDCLNYKEIVICFRKLIKSFKRNHQEMIFMILNLYYGVTLISNYHETRINQ